VDGSEQVGGTLTGDLQARVARVAARLAGEVWGGRWVPVVDDDGGDDPVPKSASVETLGSRDEFVRTLSQS
jgi:hypothetical protein